MVDTFILYQETQSDLLTVRKNRKYNQRNKKHTTSSAMAGFSDDDDDSSLCREVRRNRIMGEIERRRQRLRQSDQWLLGLDDPTALDATADSLYAGGAASDYSSHIPHYGSLPRSIGRRSGLGFGAENYGRSLPRYLYINN